MKKVLNKLCIAISLIICSLSHAEDFKRFSVSAGWLHVMPQGKANSFNINTMANPSTSYDVGSISSTAFLNSIDPNATINGFEIKPTLESFFVVDPDTGKSLAQSIGLADENNNVLGSVSGKTNIYGIDQWTQQGAGLEAEDVDTLGLTFNYYLNDNVSLQFIGGLPPKVDIKGRGEIIAPMTGLAFPQGGLEQIFTDGISLKQDIPITNLSSQSKAASVRAWTPAIEAQYQFGKLGINKFRPYIGAGVMYSHFSNIKLNGQINSDLIAAGHMIQNILDNKAGAALEGKISSADPSVKVKTTDSLSPIVTLGATYDINTNWYGVASVSYAKMNNQAKIDVVDRNSGNYLIRSSTKVDIDPLITYLGVGYRF
jgi:outer membrane protein